jgi:hypothetical protein
MRLRTRLAAAFVIVSAMMACSENTENQNLNDNHHLWPALGDLGNTPSRALTLTDFGPQQAPPAAAGSLGPVLTDILAHLPASFGSKYYNADLTTWGHETTHGIHEYLRSRHNPTGRKAAAFYLLNDKAAVVVEPKVLKRRVAEFIPLALQGENYALYITGQTVWDDTPLYILDEFFGQLNGAAVALDRRYSRTESPDFAPAALVEFVSYGIALAMAVQKYDPAYFTDNHQFSAVLAVAIERAMLLYRHAAATAEAGLPAEKQAQRLYHNLTVDQSGAPMREFALRLFGATWTNRVLLAPVSADTGHDGDLLTQLQQTLPAAAPDKDGDSDGVPDRLDRCPKSAAGKAKVWTYGEWIGCAEGEQRN